MDTFAAMAMASLPARREVMDEPPRPRDEFIITPAMARTIFTCGITFVAVLLGIIFKFSCSWFNIFLPKGDSSFAVAALSALSMSGERK